MKFPFVNECGQFKVSYSADMAIYKNTRVLHRIIVMVALLFLLPIVLPDYYLSIAVMIGIASIAAIGLNILTGFTGLISIGVGAFMGVGAYTSGLLSLYFGWPFWITLPLAGVMTACIGGIFGIPSLRLKGIYLAMATLASQTIILYVIKSWKSLTGGNNGIILSRPSFFGYSLDSEQSYYLLVLTILILVVVFSFNLFRSRVGRALVAIRDRDIAAEVMGIHLFWYKLLSFMISSFLIGIAGALMAHYLMVATPEHFGLDVSIQYLAMILIGGLGSVMGSIYGAVLLTILPIFIREGLNSFFPGLTFALSGIEGAFFGLIILLFLIFEPEGLNKIWHNVKQYFKLWPYSH